MIRMLKTMPPTAILGVLVIAAYAVIALFAPLLAPHAEAQIVAPSSSRGAPPIPLAPTRWAGTCCRG